MIKFLLTNLVVAITIGIVISQKSSNLTLDTVVIRHQPWNLFIVIKNNWIQYAAVCGLVFHSFMWFL